MSNHQSHVKEWSLFTAGGGAVEKVLKFSLPLVQHLFLMPVHVYS